MSGPVSGAGEEATGRGRRRPVRDLVVRTVFLGVVLGCAVWSLDGRWDEVGDALRGVAPLSLAAAVLLTCAGLAVTAVVWRRLLVSFGHDVPGRPARSVFFVSQLGKYVPGAVWAIGVQARLAMRYAVPVRVSVTVALLFTGVHLLTAGLFAGVVVLVAGVEVPGPRWGWALGTLGCAVGLVPAVLSRLVARAAGTPWSARARDALGVVALMALVWVLYAGAVLLLVPDPSPTLWAAVAVAFAAGYVAGVLVVVAPAGLGARETVFVLVLSPVTGLPVATAVALLARLVHGAADLAMAALAWTDARRVGAGAEAGGASGTGAGATRGSELSVAGGTVRGHDDDRL
ncbi:lysylphosphatidylglycerol synthase domain-containing protein [Nocardioides zeae]|uniref:Lysylphosphatidylglycerol synthase domain-containing protein n=1 Tax=Nocardioides imazamoxiresistens TaxID=3231893 RepID=A0ABU3PX32_9ACTN|nr:lysylphosphatidylglycerol synthase domain-containing protein [Nocardioides zeae]MDT9593797.1 lysylphosphatidylglycerol synthase domain-containing protein [Nocardioides zeae]